jgi:hypothetical protein
MSASYNKLQRTGCRTRQSIDKLRAQGGQAYANHRSSFVFHEVTESPCRRSKSAVIGEQLAYLLTYIKTCSPMLFWHLYVDGDAVVEAACS